jgi:hypothetical protein
LPERGEHAHWSRRCGGIVPLGFAALPAIDQFEITLFHGCCESRIAQCVFICEANTVPAGADANFSSAGAGPGAG